MKPELKENIKKAGAEFLKMSSLLSLLIFLIFLFIYLVRHMLGLPVCVPTGVNLLIIIADCLMIGFSLGTLISLAIISFLIFKLK
jgi:hypothetical protein